MSQNWLWRPECRIRLCIEAQQLARGFGGISRQTRSATAVQSHRWITQIVRQEGETTSVSSVTAFVLKAPSLGGSFVSASLLAQCRLIDLVVLASSWLRFHAASPFEDDDNMFAESAYIVRKYLVPKYLDSWYQMHRYDSLMHSQRLTVVCMKFPKKYLYLTFSFWAISLLSGQVLAKCT
ncbi:hypothetical protein P152DRAFT_461331 [Eremomyces bilateralis CBS 781.70]|uniref:Uncharacterized protein n=1 Tax=Eremomyces bilateralis CBS 781.70 TaxID=1392243 RepID=A0A6G1FUS4_9PEZI|nr:uncharacterized protein P152DRAFT_461331 [Eremomyces bilateralis CBS 781.70]KAF1809645.1 hypothetical protein P152DRAFT_461331 [Eremomyces bilateralis CBS 781.70]